MSQDQLPPSEPEPSQIPPADQGNLQSSETPPSGSSTDSLVRSLQQIWERSLPVLKTQGSNLLNRSIQTLDWALARLETLFIQSDTPSPSDKQPFSPSNGTSQKPSESTSLDDELEDFWDTPNPSSFPKPPASPKSPTTSGLPEQVADLASKVRPYVEKAQRKVSPLLEKIQLVLAKARPTLDSALSKAQPAIEKVRPAFDTALEKTRPALAKLQQRWPTVLTKIRSILPGSLNDQLSDRALTGLVVGFLVVLLWVSTGVLFGNSSQVQQTPSVSKRTAPTQVSTQAQPSAPTASVTPQPVPSPTASVAAVPPTLNLTPGQSLIAAIQDQVAEVTDRYTEGLIQATQANFRSSLLMVRLGVEWYGLPYEQQDKLADDLLKRSREIGFKKLEITNPQGVLLARSPVVGDRMVVLRRSEVEE